MLPSQRNGSSALGYTVRPSNRLSSLVDHFLTNDFLAPQAPAQSGPVRALALWQDEQNFYVEMDLPGVTDKDVELSLHDGDLIIGGVRQGAPREGGYDARSYGQFQQRVTLPAAVERDKVEAKLINGVLSVTLPKSAEAKPRKIDIKTA